MFAALRAVFGDGRHRLKSHRIRDGVSKPQTVVEVVDATTKQAHFLSIDAERRDGGGGPYSALCGTDVTPAAMVEPGRGYCRSCSSSTTIPTRGTP
ncbi:MAG: hypothetical protein ACRDRH_02580 [Pseudonocardia sp.]